MIIVNILAPEKLEQLASVVVDATGSFDTDDPYTPLSFSYALSTNECVVEEISNGVVRIIGGVDFDPDNTIDLTVTVFNDISSPQDKTITLTCIAPRVEDDLELEVGVPDNLVICPSGSWAFDIDVPQTVGELVARSLDPNKVRVYMTRAGLTKLVDSTTVSSSLYKWRTTCLPAYIEERPANRRGKLSNVNYSVNSGAYIQLDEPVTSIIEVLWMNPETPDLVEIPNYTYSSVSNRVVFSRELTDRYLAGEFTYVTVVYEAKDLESSTSWFQSLGLEPFGTYETVLTVRYGTAENSPVARKSVVVSGTKKLKPTYDLWWRDGNTAVFRENYSGVFYE